MGVANFVVYLSESEGSIKERALPLISVCAELVRRNHRCRFIARRSEVVVAGFSNLAPRRVVEKIQAEVLVDIETTPEEVITRVVTELEEAGGRVVGIVDVMARRGASIFLEQGVPYYATFSGTVASLASAGAIRSLWYRTHALAARRVFDGCVACFSSSLEEEQTGCLPATPDKVHLVRSFGPPRDVLPDTELDSLFDEDDRPVVLVAIGHDDLHSLTAPGIRALYQGLALNKHRWRVVWHVANVAVYEDARLADEADPPSDDWFRATHTLWLPQLSLLAKRDVRCLVTDCAWTDVTDALSCAVPILAAPITLEQRDNALFCKTLGVARVLDTVDPTVRRFQPPNDPEIRMAERITPALVSRHLLDLLKPQAPAQLRALSLQLNAYSQPDDVGSAFVATVLEADHHDGTLDDHLRATTTLETTTISKRSADYYVCVAPDPNFFCHVPSFLRSVEQEEEPSPRQ
ncbi:hypothetical protein CTAYLR_005844 [Chrysophaeum taylorii]|uniref:Uncharacterized protein n=1 Tax=Chrysophaeum taylorii TaxID=2483200 RepID=A0AAD7UNT2_9STRA|nr:hypothetical protein CTAYLR_005844 [Chrysophaeum taylorii]